MTQEIQNILDHYYEDEREHFQSMKDSGEDTENHIFLSLESLRLKAEKLGQTSK